MYWVYLALIVWAGYEFRDAVDTSTRVAAGLAGLGLWALVFLVA